MRAARIAVLVSLLVGCGARSPIESDEGTGPPDAGTPPPKPPLWFVHLRADSTSPIGPILVGADAIGNAYVAAGFESVKGSREIDFGGPIPCGSSSFHRAFVARFDGEGHRSWVRCFAGVDADSSLTLTALAVGPSGDVALTGQFDGSVDFGAPPTTADVSSDFVLALDASGATRFVAQYDEGFMPYDQEPGDTSLGAAVDAAGRVVVAGITPPTPPFGLPPDAKGVFAASFEANGTRRWSRAYGGYGSGEPVAVAIAPDGKVAMGLSMSGRIDGSSADAGYGRPFVIETRANGELQWAAAVRTDASSSFRSGGSAGSVTFTASGELVVGGSQPVPLDFVMGSPTKFGAALFTALLDERGQVRQQETAAIFKGYGVVATNAASRFLLAADLQIGGSFEGSPCLDVACIVLATADASGKLQATRALRTPGATSYATLSGAAFGHQALLVAAQVHAPVVDFGDATVDTRGDQAFLVALPE